MFVTTEVVSVAIAEIRKNKNENCDVFKNTYCDTIWMVKQFHEFLEGFPTF